MFLISLILSQIKTNVLYRGTYTNYISEGIQDKGEKTWNKLYVILLYLFCFFHFWEPWNGDRERRRDRSGIGRGGEADWNQQCCKDTGTLHSISMTDSTMHRQLDSLYTCTCCCNARWIHTVKQRIAQAQPSPPSVSLSIPLPLVFSWLLSHSHKQRMGKWERNKALVPHALTQHLCLSWFQMNKAEYQVAHLYATQRQIDQSITAGCCWITNALWCVCGCV